MVVYAALPGTPPPIALVCQDMACAYDRIPHAWTGSIRWWELSSLSTTLFPWASSSSFIATMASLKISDEDLAYFKSIPWCASLINDDSYTITPTWSREPKKSSEDLLFGETLHTDRTISACLSLYKKPAPLDRQIEEVKTLLALNAGVNGYPNVCHGGVVATMLDEVMGILLTLNKDRAGEIARAGGRVPERPATVTAELVVKVSETGCHAADCLCNSEAFEG